MTACTRRCRDALGNARAAAHCTTCHQTFTGTGPFDRHHQQGDEPDIVWCRPPTSVGLERKRNGRWGTPPPDAAPEHWRT